VSILSLTNLHWYSASIEPHHWSTSADGIKTYRFTLLPGSGALSLFLSSLLLLHSCGDNRIGVNLAFPIHSERTQAVASTRTSLCQPASVVGGTRHENQGDQTVKETEWLVSEHAQKLRRELRPELRPQDIEEASETYSEAWS